jgi:hypothetical protein
LIGDRSSSVNVVSIYGDDSSQSRNFSVTDPTASLQVARLVFQADAIAQGLSRWSFLPPPAGIDTHGIAMLPGEKLKAFPGDLGVECHGSTNYKNVHETVTAILATVSNSTLGSNSVSVVGRVTNYSMALLDCNYEQTTPYKTISDTPNTNGWSVISRSSFEFSFYLYLDNHTNLFDFAPNDGVVTNLTVPVAVDNHDSVATKDDHFNFVLQLKENETALPVSRGQWTEIDSEGNNTFRVGVGGVYNWQYGRRVRDGLSFRLGHVLWLNNNSDYVAQGPHPGAMEFQVEHTVLSGPGHTSISEGGVAYTLSSWSRSCPFFDDDKKKISIIGVDNERNVSGCVIDFALSCASRFPEDVDYVDASLNPNLTLEEPYCTINNFGVTLMAGNIEVDPYMLVSGNKTCVMLPAGRPVCFFLSQSHLIRCVCALYRSNSFPLRRRRMRELRPATMA